jgi:hypothetical protein
MSYAWVDVGNGRQVYRKIETSVPKRSHLAAPMINSDTMSETQSMLDGKIYTSKSRLRQTYREAGVVEVGDDPQRFKRERPTPDRKKIRETIRKAASDFNNGRRFDPKPVQA